jgi:uncharacterized protein involved in exopolysaccharide biosynthesis
MYLPEGSSQRAEDDAFDLHTSVQRVLDACRTYRPAFAATALAIFALVALYVLIWPPIYEAEVVLVSESHKDSTRNTFYEPWNLFRREELTTEAELLTSRTVLERVVREMGLKYEDVYHPFSSHLASLWRDSWLGRQYRAAKRFVFPRERKPYEPTPEQIEVARTVKDFKEGLTLEAVPDANVGHLIVRGPSPRVGEIANTLVEIYLDERNRNFTEQAQRAYDALAAEMKKAGTELAATDAARRRFYEENGLVLDFEKDKQEVALTTTFGLSVHENEAELEGLRRKLDAIQKQLAAEPADQVKLRVTEENKLRERMKLERFELQAKLADLSLRYRPDSPEVKELQERISQLDTQIAAEPERVETSVHSALSDVREQLRERQLLVEAEVPRLTADLLARKRTLGQYNADQALLPGKLTQALELARGQAVQEQHYKLLADRLAMARASLATVRSAPPSLRVADSAQTPADPVWPFTRLFLVGGALLGLLGGTVVAVMLDLVRGRVTRPRLQQLRGGLPVYGTISLLPASPARRLLPPLTPHDPASVTPPEEM